MRDTKKILQRKTIHLKKIYKFAVDHFLLKCTVFVLILKNVIIIKKLNFPTKLCDMRKKCYRKKCSFQKDLQICFWLFFDKMHSFCFNVEKCDSKKFHFQVYATMRHTKKMLRNKTSYLEQIYTFLHSHQRRY